MTIEQIIKMYGKNDYYEMNTGKLYKISSALRQENGDLIIPVYVGSFQVGTVRAKGEKVGN